MLIALTACASFREPPALTFVVVRHAEKATDDPRDPSLTAAGEARAQRIAESLESAPVVAVYSTAYRRTQQTAAPTAQAHAVPVTTYDTQASAEIFAALLRKNHRDGHVLVVAHSNTAPAIASALCACDVEPMPETEYDRRMTVHVPPEGPVILITASMQ
ncbi:MAG: histidine phosphatase family protein [Pseudomonadota bacterium]|nr:histidine phosphatase family protein [Pseudomonadota bacterium]